MRIGFTRIWGWKKCMYEREKIQGFFCLELHIIGRIGHWDWEGVLWFLSGLSD